MREALGRLNVEGLVTFRPRRGYIVTGWGPEEITEVFDMRMVLEEHAGFTAAAYISAGLSILCATALARVSPTTKSTFL